MYRTLPYLLLFVVMVLLQVFLFDNLSMSIYLNPLVYVAFIALLPLDTRPIVMLLSGLVMGVVMDCTMGAAGENTIATLLIAFLRGWIITLLHGGDISRDGGTPSPERMGDRTFVEYLAVLVLIHHLVFFSLETLSWVHAANVAMRVVLSGVVSVGFIWIIARVFISKFSIRV